MHKSVFHLGQNDVVLFKNWVLYSQKETFFTCLFFVMLGVFHQGTKFVRQQYGRKCQNMKCKGYILSKGHILQTLMYIAQFLWGYSLMLSVMTYNVWLMISVLAGSGLGYFFFGWGEYENRSSSHQLQNQADECGKECKATCATSSTQEFLLGEESYEVAFRIDESSAIMKCNCDDSEL